MRELLTVIGGIFAIFFVFIGMSVLIQEVISNHQCATYEQKTGIETKRAFLDLCYVNTADGWQRWDEYKVRSTAKDALNSDQGKRES